MKPGDYIIKPDGSCEATIWRVTLGPLAIRTLCRSFRSTGSLTAFPAKCMCRSNLLSHIFVKLGGLPY
jgi:hypothetical protein